MCAKQALETEPMRINGKKGEGMITFQIQFRDIFFLGFPIY